MRLFLSVVSVALLFQPSKSLACSIAPEHPFAASLPALTSRTETILLVKPEQSEPERVLMLWKSGLYKWTFQVQAVLKGNFDSQSLSVDHVMPIPPNKNYASFSTLSPSCDPVVVGFKPGESYVVFVGAENRLNYKSASPEWLNTVKSEINRKH